MENIKDVDVLKVAKLQIETLSLDDMTPWEGNPRIDLKPEDIEYKNIKASIAHFDYLEPIVFNKRSGRIVGGHQRVKVLKDLGFTHAEVRVVDFDEQDEISANSALNKAVGRWDDSKLPAVFEKLDEEHRKLTGFSDTEIEIQLSKLDHNIREPKPKGEYTKVEWDSFKIWHACVGPRIYICPGFRYLASMGVEDGKPISKPKPEDCQLFTDSGLLTGARREGHTYYQRQGDLVEFAIDSNADWATMMDIPMVKEVLDPLKLTIERAMDIHLSNVRDFSRERLGEIKKVLVVQGSEFVQYRWCAEQMLPYVKETDVVALGGLTKFQSSQADYVVKVCQMIRSLYPTNEIHLFGVTNPRTVADCYHVGATSCDSATASLITSSSSLAIPQQIDGHYKIKRVPLKDLTGFPLSVGGRTMPRYQD